MMDRKTVSLEDYQIEAAERLRAESRDIDGVAEIRSDSEAIRYLLDHAVESIGESDDPLSDVIPDEKLYAQRRERLKKEHKEVFRAGKIAHRFAEKADQLLRGDTGERAAPSVVEEIAGGYLAEIDAAEEFGVIDHAAAEDQREAIDAKLAEYREDFEAADHAPRHRDRDADAELGEDVRHLRDQIGDVTEFLEGRAEGDSTDPDAIRDAAARRFAVEPRSVDLVIDLMVPDDVDPREALRNGAEFRSILPHDSGEPLPEGESVEESERDESDAQEPSEEPQIETEARSAARDGGSEMDPEEFLSGVDIERAVEMRRDGAPMSEIHIEVGVGRENPVQREALDEVVAQRVAQEPSEPVEESLATDGGESR